MTKETLIKKTIGTLSKLSDHEVKRVADFASEILKEHEHIALQKGIAQLAETSKTYSFLDSEDDLYTVNDLKEKYR